MPEERQAAPEVLTIEEEHVLRREVKQLKAKLRDAAERIAGNLKLNNFVESLMNNLPGEVPAWVYTPKKQANQAVPTAFLSDAHFGEVVFPEQVEGVNAYNREIALSRLKKFFYNTICLSREYLAGMSYPGIALPLGGDMFSGDIHAELDKSNEGTIQEEVLYWLDPMVAGIKMLADEFGRVYVPSVVGNHPRGTHKPVAKMRVANNFDFLFAKLLEKLLKGDKRITFNISASADCDYKLYDTRFRLSHGDQFRGGSGIAGLLSPLMIGDSRKRKRSQALNRPYDYLVLGHWHQLMYFRNIIVNGSLKGYDEYAYVSNFDLEPPRQAFWLTTPKHGITITAPIHVASENESWRGKVTQGREGF